MVKQEVTQEAPMVTAEATAVNVSERVAATPVVASPDEKIVPAVVTNDVVADDVATQDTASRIEQAIRDGQYREAVGLCARAYAAPLGKLCFAFVGSQAEAEELVQETLLAALDAFPQFRAEGTVKSFLYAIARRRCGRALEQRAQREARVRLAHETALSAEDMRQAAHRGDSAFLTGLRARQTRQALADLRPTDREAVLLRYQGELSFHDVAAACGCDEATARKRVSRALARLREVLTDET